MEKSEKSVRDFFIEPEDKASIEEMVECRDHVVRVINPIIEALRGGLNELTREELEEITNILMRAALDISAIMHDKKENEGSDRK